MTGLFTLLRRYLLTQTQRCLEQSIRINVIGRRDRLSGPLRQLIENSERITAQCTGMRLRIAIDYSSQHSLLETCRRLRFQTDVDRSRFMEQLAAVDHSSPSTPEVDLLIRTGGEKRLSDFLLWECAYAELHFVDCLWPDFDGAELDKAIGSFTKRERRFGDVGESGQGEGAVGDGSSVSA